MTDMRLIVQRTDDGRLAAMNFEDITEDAEGSLQHFGVKGMKWGVKRDNSRASGSSSSGSAKPGLSRNKKIAIGVGAGVVVAGAAVGVALLAKNGKLPIDQIRGLGSKSMRRGKEVASGINKSPAVSSIRRMAKSEVDGARKVIKNEVAGVGRVAKKATRAVEGVQTQRQFKKLTNPLESARKIETADDFIKKLRDPNHIWDL